MILTNCAACAAPLPHKAKQCSRCKTRYCGPACQRQHWERGGHDALCKKIKKGGGAEQYYADKKYKEAVAEAAEACADDTKGQTCYICTQALHWKTKEGLVRGCACRGTSGFAHVSCLAEQVKILVAEVEENNLGNKAFDERWERWYSCSLCGQDYHGVVLCAMGWAGWKTYLGRPETDWAHGLAMSLLGSGLSSADHDEEALSVDETRLSMMRRLGACEHNMLVMQGNLAVTYERLGRHEESLRMRQEVYSGHLRLNGKEHLETLRGAYNNVNSLYHLRRFTEAKSLMRKTVPVARRVLGEGDRLTLKMNWLYAKALHEDPAAALDDLRDAVTTLEETERTARRVLGVSHPITAGIEKNLRGAREALRARETPPGS